MSIAVFEINGTVRAAVEVFDVVIKMDKSTLNDMVIPIAIVGDSSRDKPTQTIFKMLADLGYHGPFVADMLLVNGTCNRYVKFEPVLINGRDNWAAKTPRSGEFEVSDALHRRCNELQFKLYERVDECNVLTAAQKYALSAKIHIALKEPI